MTEPWQIHVCPVHGPRTPTMLGDCPVGCCAEVMEVVRVVRDTREDRMGVIESDEREDAYRRGYEMGRVDEREVAIKAGLYRKGRYLTPDELTRGAVDALRSLVPYLTRGGVPIDGPDARAMRTIVGDALAALGGQSTAEEAFEQSSGGETLEEAQARQLRGEHAFSPQPDTRGAVDEEGQR